jgi:hypothetical protein
VSTKHNAKHPERIRKRPRTFGHLEDVDTLRQRQQTREKNTGSPVKLVEQEKEAA